MANSINLSELQHVFKTFNRITTTIGVTIGVILLLYFFSFATLIDKAPAILFEIQATTAIFFIIALVYVKRISFFLTKLLLAKRESYAALIELISIDDLEKKIDVLRVELESRSQTFNTNPSS